MTTLSRLFLILAGLFVGLWLRGGDGALSEIGLPALALLALVLAVAGAPGSGTAEARARLEGTYRQWLDAWQRMRAAPERDVPAAAATFASASHALTLVANDRVLKALKAAAGQEFSVSAVANLVVEMRRSIGRPSVGLRSGDVEHLLIGLPGHAPTAGRTSAPTLRAHADSFLG
jgi:hypothetical protein